MNTIQALPQSFYAGNTVETARRLLGKLLVRQYGGKLLAVRITETEAYVGRMDKACHAYQYRRTRRTETLFAPPGTAYIYLIYGMYHCLNFVTEPEGEPSAVLIRGGEAVLGSETMSRLRYGKAWEVLTPYQRRNFLNGPGKLCKALALTRAQDGLPLTGPELWVTEEPGLGLPPWEERRPILTGKRVGIDYAEEAADFPWRFYYGEEERYSHEAV
ncbi:MAG: DNA-3-methyladenine glycosylase [Clostridiales bacterium]|nr:DNA-3-methyladenine glycosylase [Clostridiales bacterium]